MSHPRQVKTVKPKKVGRKPSVQRAANRKTSREHIVLAELSRLNSADRELVIEAIRQPLTPKTQASLARKTGVTGEKLQKTLERIEKRVEAVVRRQGAAPSSARTHHKASTDVLPATPPQAPPNGLPGMWTPEKNNRRCDLIHQEIYGELTAAEAAELRDLEELVDVYQQRTAPLPIEAARRLHRQLKRQVSRQGAED